MTTIHKPDTPTGDTRVHDVETGSIVPRSHITTSILGLGPIPFTQVLNVLALTHEARRNPNRGTGLTHLETVVRSGAERKAQRRLDRTTRRAIEPLIRLIKAEHAEINLIDEVRRQLPDTSMMGPNGEQLQPAEARHTHNLAREQIATAIRSGSLKHHLTTRRPWRDIGLLLADFPVFLFAMLGLLNVQLRLIGWDFATNVKATIATLFALLGTMLLGIVARRLGRRHRSYKDDTGHISSQARTPAVIAEMIGAALIISISAIVMGYRVYTEGHKAGMDPVLGVALAALFGILIGFSAYINYRAEFDNGSHETDHVQHLSHQIRTREHDIQTLDNQRKLKVEQTGVNTAKLQRAITNARTVARTTVTSSATDRAIHLARSYSAHPVTTLPDPRLNFTCLDVAAEQARQLAAHQAYLETDQPLYPEDLFTYSKEQ